MSEEAQVESHEGAPEVSEAEAKARRLGWVPKEEFKGNPDKHRSAEEFLERGESLLPLLKRDTDKLHRMVDRLEKKLTDQSKTFSEYREFSEKAEERAYKRAKAELEAKLDTAIQSADVDGARQARRELADLENDKPKPKTETKTEEKPAIDPVFQSWMDENSWFGKDPALTGFANKVFAQLEVSHPGKPHSELLAETRKRVVEKFPEDFGINPKRDDAAAVASPNGGAAPRKKGKTYDDLPADAKKACDRFVKTIPGYTREKYVASYEWD
jgi:hypothetical protein